MKKILYGFLFLFFAITQGYYLVYGNKNGGQRMDYNQAIGLKTNQIVLMNLGYRPLDGYNVNISSPEKIKTVIDFLKKQQFIKKESSIKSDDYCNRLYYRISLYTPGEGKPRVNITLDAFQGKEIKVNNTTYVLSKSDPDEMKNLFENLKK